MQFLIIYAKQATARLGETMLQRFSKVRRSKSQRQISSFTVNFQNDALKNLFV